MKKLFIICIVAMLFCNCTRKASFYETANAKPYINMEEAYSEYYHNDNMSMDTTCVPLDITKINEVIFLEHYCVIYYDNNNITIECSYDNLYDIIECKYVLSFIENEIYRDIIVSEFSEKCRICYDFENNEYIIYMH